MKLLGYYYYGIPKSTLLLFWWKFCHLAKQKNNELNHRVLRIADQNSVGG